MPPTVAIGFSLFVGAFMAGFSLYDLYLKQKETETKLKEYEERLAELESGNDEHDQVLQEHEIRLREKKDYDEFDEQEEDKYQAWVGNVTMDVGFTLTIRLWKKALTSYKKNQEWTNEGTEHSTAVCDYYLGNRNPDFNWTFTDDTLFTAGVSETFVDGWDNTVCLQVSVSTSDRKIFSDFIGETSFNGDKTMNELLKKCMNDGSISWSRVLIDA
jgi:hypothetical protein